MVQVNVRVTPEIHKWLTSEAKLTQTTVTAVVTKALLEHFDRGGKGK